MIAAREPRGWEGEALKRYKFPLLSAEDIAPLRLTPMRVDMYRSWHQGEDTLSIARRWGRSREVTRRHIRTLAERLQKLRKVREWGDLRK